MDSVGKPFVYVPIGAKINVTNQPIEQVKIKYEKDCATFDREKVNEIVKGNYGSPENNPAKL